MATFIALIDFTEKGVGAFTETTKRAAAFAEKASQAGVEVKDVYWCVGSHDGVLILEAPDEKTATSVLLWLGSQGNVRTHTLRAFDRSEMESIVGQAG